MTNDTLIHETAAMPVAACPHCDSPLKVSRIPASGNCPVCEGGLQVSIHALNERGEPDADHPGFVSGKLAWLVAGVLLVTLLVVIFVIETSVRLSATRVDDYQDACDNRFTGWPSNCFPNPDCPVPEEVLTGLGWDDDGSSHALVASSFIVTSHNRVPPKVHFRSADGRRFSRKTTDNYTMVRDPSGQPFIRLCRLDQPLPPDIAPLPVLTFDKDTPLCGDLLVFGRQGRIGHESGALVNFSRGIDRGGDDRVERGELSTAPGFGQQGQIRLGPGDSGSPALLRVRGQWTLAALASATRIRNPSGQFLFDHVYAVPGPHLEAMRMAGAEVRAVPMLPTADSGPIRRVVQNTPPERVQ
jgi:hypothetical protein